MSGLEVRPLAPGEAEALGRLMFRAVHEGTGRHYGAEARAAWCPEPPAGPEWEARLTGAQTLVAERDGVPCGFMALDGARIDLAYVLPEAMGRGVADALYAVIEGRARAAGLPRLVTEASDVALSFFRRHGWREIRRQAIERGGVAVHNTVMDKTLARLARHDAA